MSLPSDKVKVYLFRLTSIGICLGAFGLPLRPQSRTESQVDVDERARVVTGWVSRSGHIHHNIGPPGNSPQTGIENNYQVVNNISYILGNHSLKFGGDFRKIISPQTFTQRGRGDYQYVEAQIYFYDLTPDRTAQRGVGDIVYYGDQKILYVFAQDDWRVRPNLNTQSWCELVLSTNADRGETPSP